MNRISRRSAAEAAEALLEVGRTEPVLQYDVEVGLARHHHWLRNEAPLPEWASAGVGTAAKTWLSFVTKTLVSTVLIGALGTAAWYARDRLQPSPAEVKRASPTAEPIPTATDSEAWLATTPIPVPDHVVLHDQAARQTGATDMHDKHPTRASRAHKERTSARAASARAELAVPHAESSASPASVAQASGPADATSARVEPSTRTQSSDVAPAPERKPARVAPKERPEPAPQAQAPDDLVEMQEVATAEKLLERSPERALTLVHRGDQRFAHGYFQQERAYIAIMALIRLGRIEEARGRAASFAKQFPALPYGARIRSALEAQKAKAPGAGSRDAVP